MRPTSIIAVWLFLFLSAVGLPQAKHEASPEPSEALEFGDVHIRVPSGWKHVESQAGANNIGVLLIVPPDVTAKRNLAVLVLPGQDLKGASFAQAVDAVLKKSLAPNEHLIQFSELPARKEGDYEFLARAMVVGNDAGRIVRICFAANPGDRLEMMIVSADSNETLKHYQADVAALLKSYSFKESVATAKPEGGAAHGSSTADPVDPGRAAPEKGQNAKPGAIARIADGDSVLVCTDPARLDGAMDFAKLGDSYNALRALRNDAFFRVAGPASLEIKETDLKSRWPKAFVKVSGGYFDGRSGWAVLSELKDLQSAAK